MFAVPEEYSDPVKQEKWKAFGGLAVIKREVYFYINYINLSQFEVMKEMAQSSGSPIVFSHNDLLGGNVIVNEETGS